MQVQPIQDRLLVRVMKAEEVTAGGIVIPDAAKEKPLEGVVVAVGRGKVLEDGTVLPLEVKAGDRVVYARYAGSEVKVDGETLLILREDDLLLVYRG